MYQVCDKLSVLMPGLIPANKIQMARLVSDIMVSAISISDDIMTSTFFFSEEFPKSEMVTACAWAFCIYMASFTKIR